MRVTYVRCSRRHSSLSTSCTRWVAPYRRLSIRCLPRLCSTATATLHETSWLTLPRSSAKHWKQRSSNLTSTVRRWRSSGSSRRSSSRMATGRVRFVTRKDFVVYWVVRTRTCMRWRRSSSSVRSRWVRGGRLTRRRRRALTGLVATSSRVMVRRDTGRHVRSSK